MKISIGYEIIDGPWGGGNRFIRSLCKALEKRGHQVVFRLNEDNIDLILLVDPRRGKNIPFGPKEALRYQSFKNNDAVIVHRINECDERKKTRTMNLRLKIANYTADHTVFVGSWLKELNLWNKKGAHSVILNGADTAVFNSIGYKKWYPNQKLKLVTHHWGGNMMKGFDIYSRIDKLLDDPRWGEKIEFTYIGNLPNGVKFNRTRYVSPLTGAALANEIKKNHVYITASLNEPGGNHQVEGANCGLPLIFRNSGCMPEYCEGFGVMFEGRNDIEAAILEMIEKYSTFQAQMKNFSLNHLNTTKEYIELFEELYSNRTKISLTREARKKSFLFLLNKLTI